MKRFFWLLAAAGCVSESEPYSVMAIAHLEPLDAQISGDLELLSPNGVGSAPEKYGVYSIAAYHVSLPDDAPRDVVIYNADSCATPRENLPAISELPEIRRVADEAHFFAVGMDIVLAEAFVSMDPDFLPELYVPGKIAVVQELAPPDGAPPAWLACGVFSLR